MEIKLPVEWLKEKGITPSVKDKIVNMVGNTAAWNDRDSLNIDRLWEGWYVTAFADRENTGKPPVADWVPVECKGPFWAGIVVDARGLNWNLTGSHGIKFAWIKSWKPSAKALMEIYTAEQNKIKESEIDELNKQIAPEPTGSSSEYWELVKNQLFGTEIDNTANVYGVEQPTMVSDAAKALSKKRKADFVNAFTKFGIIDKKETKLKLTKDDIGKEFLYFGEIAKVCNVSDSAERFVLSTSTDGFIIVNKNGESCTSDSYQLEQYEPRYWLKDLPDADLFSKDVSSIHFEGDMNWYVTDVNGHEHWCPYNDLPKLDDNDRKLSKISIDDLREWQRVNK